MPNLTSIAKQDYSRLLASQTLDASAGAIFGNQPRLQPNTFNRTILIGLGGTGVRTIDYVKGVIIRRLAPGWVRYVSFLGIDTDWRELGQTKFLDQTRNEKMMITTQTIQQHGENPNTRSSAQRRLVTADKLLHDLSSAGAGRKRQAGAFKLHEHVPGAAFGIDDTIVQHINTAATAVLEPLVQGNQGKYEVYVIGSLCGGTCSGGFTEIPALVERAMGGRPYAMHGVFYLPDVVSGLDPAKANKLKANGYASLKELDYYLGETMRNGYQDTWVVNDTANPEIKLPTGGKHFYELPYLVGSQTGNKDAFRVAMETVAEHFITMLTEMTAVGGHPGVFSVESFISNALPLTGMRLNDEHREFAGENHERPRQYAAVGYATASAAEMLTRAYVVSEVCQKAGIRSVSPKVHGQLAATGVSILPFRGEDDFFPAVAGTAAAQQLLGGLNTFLENVHSGHMDMFEVLHLDPEDFTWDSIRKGNYDDEGTKDSCQVYVENNSDFSTKNELQNMIRNLFRSYKNNVIQYIQQEGPLAFVNVFDGKFLQDGDNSGIGIRIMLENLRDGKEMQSGAEYDWISPANAANNLSAVRRKIDQVNVLNPLKLAERIPQKTAWKLAFEGQYAAEINKKRREYVFKANNLFDTEFLQPARILRDQIEAFGYVLKSLTAVYDSFADSFSSFSKFQNATEAPNEVNIAALGQTTYNWLRDKADQALATVNAQQTRNALINSFFEDPSKWLDFSQELVRQSAADPSRLELVSEDSPIPARVTFDRFISFQVPQTIDVSIKMLFDELQNSGGQSYVQTAQQIAHSLRAKSQPQINGNVTPNYIVAVYPSALSTEGGQAIATAITAAFAAEFPSPAFSLQIFSSADASAISCYQFAAPFEVYKLNDLAAWEAQYLDTLQRAPHIASTVSKAVATELHCMSPSAVKISANEYRDIKADDELFPAVPWEEYPSLTVPATDPRIPDPITGIISYEGEIRNKIGKIVEECKELGVLYCDKLGNEQYQVHRVYCDQTIQWHPIDVNLYSSYETAFDGAGLLRKGKRLAQEVASQNGKDLGAISKMVRLENGGIFATTAPTEDAAWENAVRVLRAHVPMYCEILKTLKLFRKCSMDIDDINIVLKERLRPAMMYVLLDALFLYQDNAGRWVVKDSERGTPKPLANFAKTMYPYLPKKDKMLIENGLLGYYLFSKLDAALQGTQLENYCKKAIEYRGSLMLDEAYADDLAKGERNAALLISEREGLVEKGAQPDLPTTENDVTVTMKFQRNMANLGLSDDELKKIQLFYARTTLWDTLV